MCGQHNVRASAEDNTGQNTKDTHPIPGQKLKFLTPPGIEPGMEGRDSTDDATATDSFLNNNCKLKKIVGLYLSNNYY